MRFQAVSREEVEGSMWTTPHITVCIRDTNAKKPKVPFSTSNLGILHLEFSDLDKPYKDYKIFTQKKAKQLINFFNKWKDKIELVIVNCEAGISRSAGVCAGLTKGLGQDDSIWFKTHIPNRLVYKLILNQMNITRELIVLVGNIGTGKSTICKKYIKDGYLCISRDGLRYMNGGGEYRWDETVEPFIWEAESVVIKTFMESGRHIIIDEVGINQKMREKYINLANTFNYKPIALVMSKLDMKTCVDRRLNNPHDQPNRELWEGVWIKFDKQYSEPTLEEGFEKIIKEDSNEFQYSRINFSK